MLPTLKSEFRKLLTVRSTYILVIIALCLTAFFTYVGTGPITTQEQVGGRIIEQKAPDGVTIQEPDPNDPPVYVTKIERTLPKEKLVSNLQENLQAVSLFIAIVVVLLMAHEFRYNTINYTLTASKSRSKVLLSKILVSSTFVIVASLLTIALTVAVTYAAIAIKDLQLPTQDYDWLYIGTRLIGYVLGFSLLGLAIITLVRNLTTGIAALFVLPILNTIGSALLAMRNIEATRVLPFSALDRIGNPLQDYLPQNIPNDAITDLQRLPATVVGATGVFLGYFIVLWIVTWISFIRRDAN